MTTTQTQATTQTDSEARERQMCYGYLHSELEAAFNQVRNPDDWKAEIYATMPGEAVNIAVAAIRFYTATDPEVRLDLNTMTYHVYSIGYRNGPAGDY